jgi:hypothetical protein
MSDYIEKLTEHIRSKQQKATAFCRLCGKSLKTGQEYHVKCYNKMVAQEIENDLTEQKLNRIAFENYYKKRR